MRVLLLDTHSLFFRAFYALPSMCTSTGTPTSALYGFSALFVKLLREERPDAIALARDLPRPTFRHERFPAYKAGRARAPSELVQQLQMLDALVDAFGLPLVGTPGFEADDVLATIARDHTRRGDHVLVVSGDHDLFQLVDERTEVLFVGQRGKPAIRYDVAGIVARYGFPPARLPSYAALIGDASDNLPKLKGMGEATAKKLIAAHADIADLLARLAEISSARTRETLAAHADQLLETELLARLRDDVPLERDSAPRAFTEGAKQRTLALFEALEFKSLIARLSALPVTRSSDDDA